MAPVVIGTSVDRKMPIKCDQGELSCTQLLRRGGYRYVVICATVSVIWKSIVFVGRRVPGTSNNLIRRKAVHRHS